MPFSLLAHLADIIYSHQSNIARRQKRMDWIKLSITLSWLADGSYVDIALAHKVPIYTLHNYIDETMEKWSEKLTIKLPYRSES